MDTETHKKAEEFRELSTRIMADAIGSAAPDLVGFMDAAVKFGMTMQTQPFAHLDPSCRHQAWVNLEQACGWLKRAVEIAVNKKAQADARISANS